ncbi:hypothetical protein [Sphingobium phenoxybenzoativorans]|uniref:hypothetical protein n=1 Tax=Sphingobium phenoxybenzoativorans TaxID=1592790 RepID=UPI000872E392|nr:hypothetical protein [Sphingobium phenoxybenzoativorans]
MRLPLFLSALICAIAAVPAWADEGEIPPEIYGNYAPAGDCAKQPRVTVSKGGVFLDTAAGKSGPLPVSVCYSCAGGARYEGIQRWVYVKYGKDKWGGDNMPVILMFNAEEKKGSVLVEHDNTLKTPIGAAMGQVVQARSLRICRAGAGAGAAPVAPAPAAKMPPAAGKPVTPPLTAAPASPAQGLAGALGALLRPATLPANSFYDWRQLETAPFVTWAALPPQMLDKPMSNGEFFRRAGIATVKGQQIKVLAGGARTMVMNLYFRNDGPAVGEAALLSALREKGHAVVPVRCAKLRTMPAPKWYRLSGPGRQPALLWFAPARGQQQPWEGMSLQLDGKLPPMTPQEAAVYTDRCQ